MSTRQPTPSILDDVLTTDASRPTAIRNSAIKIDGGTQMRAHLDPATVEEYADAMTDAGWGKFPPIIAYYDGNDYWLADGFHRLAAFRSIANYSDALIPADVRSGTRRDAILHAAGANASHGLRRTNADKRRAVETLLRDEEWAKWSNMEIARRCNVSEGTVRNIRGDLERTSQITKSDQRHGADGRTTNTANIGANSGPALQPIPAPTDKEYSAAVQAAQPARPVYSAISNPDPVVAANAAAATVQIIEYDAAAPLPSWADEPAPTHYTATQPHDERIGRAQRLMALYGAVIDSEEEYGQLTGRFSDTLAMKRELTHMISHLSDLIAIIQRPEEAA